MNPESKMMVSTCETCDKHKMCQQKESLMPHDPYKRMRPFQKIGIDLVSIGSHEFLVTVDYCSNCWETDELSKTSSKAVIHKLKRHFA